MEKLVLRAFALDGGDVHYTYVNIHKNNKDTNIKGILTKNITYNGDLHTEVNTNKQMNKGVTKLSIYTIDMNNFPYYFRSIFFKIFKMSL